MNKRSVNTLLYSAMYGRGEMSTNEIYRALTNAAKRYGVRLTPHWKSTVRCALQRRQYHHPTKGVWKCRK